MHLQERTYLTLEIAAATSEFAAAFPWLLIGKNKSANCHRKNTNNYKGDIHIF